MAKKEKNLEVKEKTTKKKETKKAITPANGNDTGTNVNAE